MAKKNPLKGALIITLLALGTIAVAVFVLKPRQEKQAHEKDRSTLLFPHSDRQKIVELKIENPNGSFDLKRRAENNEEWTVESAGKNYEADKGSVDGLISTLLASKKENPIANKDLAALGLQPPRYRLVVNDGETRELSLGDDTPVDYLVFAKWGKGTDVFTTTRSLRFGLEKKLSDLRNKKVFTPPHPATLARIELRTLATDQHPAERLAFDRAEDGQWTSGTTFRAKLVASEIEAFTKQISDAVVTGFASEDPKERAKLGFGAPVASVTYVPADKNGAKEPAQVWALARTLAAEQSKDPKAPRSYKWYFGHLDQSETYEVAETFADNFKTDLLRFRNQELLKVAKKDIAGFSLSDGKSDIDFKREGTAWRVRLSSGGNEGAWLTGKTAVIDSLVDTLISLKVKRFLDGQNPAFLGLKTPTRLVELRGQAGGNESTLGTLFFGRKLKESEYAARSLNLDSPVAVDLQLEQILPMKLEQFAEVPNPASAAATATNSPPAGTSAESPAADPAAVPASGGKRVKLEATVKNLSDIKKLPAPIVKPAHKYTVEITLSDDRKLSFEFDASKAPYTVSNFLHLARNGFYDGLMFHRVIPDFVIQGGDPTSRGKTGTQGIGAGGPGYKFDNEDNDLKHQRGSLSMAHAGRDTNGSQFFIVLKPQPHLDGVHTVFAHITAGEEILDSVKPGSFMKKVEVFEQAL